jgi:hypothetical protein
VQRLTPQRLHGRLMGAVESIGALCPLIGLPLSGLVLTLGSPRIAFLVFGLAAAAATGGFLRLWLGMRLTLARAGAVSEAGGAQELSADPPTEAGEARSSAPEDSLQREAASAPLASLERPGSSGSGL